MKKSIFKGIFVFATCVFLCASASAQAARCSGRQLSLKEVAGEGDMGGKVYGNYVFTNISSKPCTLFGYPVFVLLDKSGRVMRGVKVRYGDRWRDESPSPVRLEPKLTAWFQIYYNSGMPFDLKRPPASSAKIKVIAPRTRKAFVIRSEMAPYKEVAVSAIRDGLPQ